MPRKSPYQIILTPEEEKELMERSGKRMLPYFVVQRAKMILLAARGLDNDEIALRLGTSREIVSIWRKRFYERRLAGLENQPRVAKATIAE